MLIAVRQKSLAIELSPAELAVYQMCFYVIMEVIQNHDFK